MLNELIDNFYENNLIRIVDFGHTFSPFIETTSNYIYYKSWNSCCNGYCDFYRNILLTSRYILK